MSLENLEHVLPALLNIRNPRPRAIDWETVAEEFGSEFPEDYKQLAEWYGPLTIDDWLAIVVPDPGEEGRFIIATRKEIAALASLRDERLSHGFMPHPYPGGLIPWGESIDGDTFYWRTGAREPESWTIVVAGRNDDWVEFNGTLTGYLSGLVSGEVSPDGLPPDFPGRSPFVGNSD